MQPDTAGRQTTSPRGFFAPRRATFARWWSNGYNFIKPQDLPGLSYLTVVNGTRFDAALKLLSPAQCHEILCRFVFIGAGKSVRIQGLGSGQYRVIFITGTHWEAATAKFTRQVGVQEFVGGVTFSQTKQAGSISFNTSKITLHPVAGGNAHTRRMSLEEFGRL